MPKSKAKIAEMEKILSRIPKEDTEIKDLFSRFRKQVEQLRADRVTTEQSLDGLVNQIKSVQDEQLGLRDKISGLVNKEADLNQQRIELEKKLSEINEKYSKLCKIHSELTDLWK